MRLGIIGLPQSGKTTIFNALTRGDRPTAINGGRFEVNTAVVDVPDQRVDRLVDLFRPRKITFAKVTYADIAGLEARQDMDEPKAVNHAIAGPLLNQLSQMDGFVHVVRCFENPNVPHSLGSVDPQRDIAVMDAELALNDLITIERKLERLSDEMRRGGGRDKAQIGRERALFQKLQEALLADQPLRDVELSFDEQWLLSGYGLLTRKPVLILLNMADGQESVSLDYPHIASRVAARKIKAEYGTRILSNSITTFEMLMTAIDRTLDRKNHNIDLGEFNVADIADLACAPTGAAAHRKSA